MLLQTVSIFGYFLSKVFVFLQVYGFVLQYLVQLLRVKAINT